MNLGEQLKSARKKVKLTQGQLAFLAGVSVPTVRLLEQGRGNTNSWTQTLSALNLELRGKNLPAADSLGEQITLLRKRRGLSQWRLAEMVDSTQPTISHLEQNQPSRLELLNNVLRTLGAGPILHSNQSGPAFYAHAATSSGHVTWQTPKWLSKSLRNIFGIFDLDPCSPTDNRRKAPVRAKVLYTETDDGLALAWQGKVYVNPPYGRGIGRWIAKAHEEVLCGNAKLVVALIPARTDTKWWHKDIAGHADVFFLKGRLSFDDTGQSAPFPSALALWGTRASRLKALQKALPDGWLASAQAAARRSYY